MANIFVSYSFRDSDFVDMFLDRLAKAGNTADRFTEVLPPEKYADEFSRKLSNTDAFVFVLSEYSQGSVNAWKELGAAQGLHSQLGHPAIFIVKIDPEVDIHSDLNKYPLITADRLNYDKWLPRFLYELESIITSQRADKAKQGNERKRAIATQLLARALSDSTASVAGSVASSITSAITLGAIGNTPGVLHDLFRASSRRTGKKRDRAIRDVEEMLNLDIDPVVLDQLLSSQQDRLLKHRFGNYFLFLTVLFTVISYAIIVLNSVYDWGISEIAITALIIEIPIQFVGLLYIIARNLFPNDKGKAGVAAEG